MRQTFDHKWTMRLKRALATMGTRALRLLPAEAAHDLGCRFMGGPLVSLLNPPAIKVPDLVAALPGVGNLAHPIGLAAGFDKQALVTRQVFGFNFSFVELGTITPEPQFGNPKPRLFRQKQHFGLINRMGFNSHGAEQVAGRVQVLRPKLKADQKIGINVGKNKTTPEPVALENFLSVLETFRNLGDYFVVNVSSPNTPGLRDLATEDFFENLAAGSPVPKDKLWIKLDPDMPRQKLQKLIETIVKNQFQGLILTNTRKVSWPESGGESGHNLSLVSSQVLEWAYEVHQGRLPMIGVGGILTGADILNKIMRGANAVQIYTAFVYHGPWVVYLLLQQLHYELKRNGFSSVKEAYCALY